jgi:hypothetical protein
MGQYLLDVVKSVPLARFLGFWSVMGLLNILLLGQSLTFSAGNALYAYIGIELVCRHCYTKCLFSPSHSLVLPLGKQKTQDAIFRLVRPYHSQLHCY